MLERGATKRLAACYKRLERANNRLELLSEPCRTAIIVDTSIGIIVNGGFNYFFEMDFPDNPEYGLLLMGRQRYGARALPRGFRPTNRAVTIRRSRRSAAA
jgi:hypothetical protein